MLVKMPFDVQEFEERLAPEIPGLMSLAAYLLPNRDQADDVVQRTLIRAHEQWGDYNRNLELGPWLRTILRYFVKTAIKDLKRATHNKKKYKEAFLHILATESEEEERVDSGPGNHLGECRKALSEIAQKLITLKYDEKVSCSGIAEALDRSVSWVTTTLSRTRKTLKVCLESKMSEAGT
jgi:RNA polymerase sigma-70 factor, ECF subfamily